MPPAPITGVAFFTSLHRVPPHYTIIARTKDTHEDADLGKESLFRKSARYLGDLSSQAILACSQTVLGSPTDGSSPKRPAPKVGDKSSPIFQPMLNPLKGVPFELSALCRRNSQNGMKSLPIQPRAAEDVEQEFSYNFSLERSVVLAK
nr:unnamed protein product [Spirometra erinaceieuropaei]